MPHIPLLQLRPELREQEEALNDPDDLQAELDTAYDNVQHHDGANADEMEANTTFHHLETEPSGGLVERVKRFVSKIKVNRVNNAARRTRYVMAEDDNMRYGDYESSESDNEGDLQDGIPLVRRSIHT